MLSAHWAFAVKHWLRFRRLRALICSRVRQVRLRVCTCIWKPVRFRHRRKPVVRKAQQSLCATCSFNTPARMKFQKGLHQAGYILGVVQHAALSHPEIAFTLIRNGKQVFSSDGKGQADCTGVRRIRQGNDCQYD